jgi:transcription initiation factor TFIIIB Brf1 subunit/transcription initiation factor TFIIB
MPDDKEIAARLAGVVGTTYHELLLHPVDLWRIGHQAVLARLRDALAEYTGVSSEEIQNTYEDLANANLRIPVP